MRIQDVVLCLLGLLLFRIIINYVPLVSYAYQSAAAYNRNTATLETDMAQERPVGDTEHGEDTMSNPENFNKGLANDATAAKTLTSHPAEEEDAAARDITKGAGEAEALASNVANPGPGDEISVGKTMEHKADENAMAGNVMNQEPDENMAAGSKDLDHAADDDATQTIEQRGGQRKVHRGVRMKR